MLVMVTTERLLLLLLFDTSTSTAATASASATASLPALFLLRLQSILIHRYKSQT